MTCDPTISVCRYTKPQFYADHGEMMVTPPIKEGQGVAVPPALIFGPTSEPVFFAADFSRKNETDTSSGLPIVYDIDQKSDRVLNFGANFLAAEEIDEYQYLRKTFTDDKRIPVNSIYDEMPASLRPPQEYKVGWFMSVKYVKGGRPIVLLHRAPSHEYPDYKPGANEEFYTRPVASGGPTPVYAVVHPHEYGQKIKQRPKLDTNSFGMSSSTVLAGGVAALSPKLVQNFYHNTPRVIFKGLGVAVPYAAAYWAVDQQSQALGIDDPYQRVFSNIALGGAEYSLLRHTYNNTFPRMLMPSAPEIPAFSWTQFKQVGGELVVVSGITSELTHWIGGGWGGIETLKKGGTGNLLISAGLPAALYSKLFKGYAVRAAAASTLAKTQGQRLGYRSLGTSIMRNSSYGWLARGGGLLIEGASLAYGVPLSFELGLGIGEQIWSPAFRNADYSLNEALFNEVYGKSINDSWFPSIKKWSICVKGLVTGGSEANAKISKVYNQWLEGAGITFPNQFVKNVAFPASWEGMRQADAETRAITGKDYFIDYNTVESILQDFVKQNDMSGTFKVIDLIAATDDKAYVQRGADIRALYANKQPDIQAVSNYLEKMFKGRRDLETHLTTFIRKKYADLYHRMAEVGLGVSVEIHQTKSPSGVDQDEVVIKTSAGVRKFPLSILYDSYGEVAFNDGIHIEIKRTKDGVIHLMMRKEGTELTTKIEAAWNEQAKNYTLIMRDTLPAVDPETGEKKIDPQTGEPQMITLDPTVTHTGHVMMKLAPKFNAAGNPEYTEEQRKFFRGARVTAAGGKQVGRPRPEGEIRRAQILFLEQLRQVLKAKGPEKFVESIDFTVSKDFKSKDDDFKDIRFDMTGPQPNSNPCPSGCHSSSSSSTFLRGGSHGNNFVFDEARFQEMQNILYQ